MENNLERLKAIEAERKGLLIKLQKIEEKKASVSQEVYLKVKHDYEAKLKKLDETLAENRELVAMEVERLKKDITELSQRQKELMLQLEEIELRYSIGEYSEDKYKTLESETKNELNSVSEKIKKSEERKKWFGELIGGVVEEEVVVKEEKKVEEKPKVEELTIDEHILEEKIPDEVKKLDELLVETSALLESDEDKDRAKPVEEKKEEGIACPKCGFINPPDSWYCEKCGAEILTSN